MNSTETLGLALGAGFSSGLNLYATVATLGLLQRLGMLHLPAGLQILSHPWVLGISIALYLLEFLADKIPYFDTFWDAIHTFIRPPAAPLLTFAAAGAAPPEWRWGAALLAGGVAESVEVRDFVRKEFQQIERDGNSKDPGMRKNLQSSRQMKHAEALEQPKRGDGGVKIEARRKSGAQREAERFDGIHAAPS